MGERVHKPPISLAQLSPDPWTAPFWEAAARHELGCQRCAGCGRYRMPPGPRCPGCHSTESRYEALTGDGELYTFTVVRHPLSPELAEALPHVIGVVELADAPGIRLVANVVDCDVEDVVIGMPLELVWEDVEPGRSAVYRFRPAKSGSKEVAS